MLFICGTAQAVKEADYHNGNEGADGIQKRIPRTGTAGSHKGLVDFVECGVAGGDEPGKHSRRQVPSTADSAQPAIEKQKENKIFRKMGEFPNDVVNEVQRCHADAGKEPAEKRLDDAAGVL